MEQINGANLLAMRSLAVQAKDSAITTVGNIEALVQHYVALQAENVRLQAQCQSMTEGMRDAFPVAHRLALELECLLLSCTDTAATAKWWDSAHEALEQWCEFCREDAEEVGAGDTATVTRAMLTAAHGVTLESGDVVLSARLLERIYTAMAAAAKTHNVEFSGGAPLHGAASAGT